MATADEYRKLLEQEDVQRAEAEILFESDINGVAFCSPDGTFIKVNRRFAALLDYAPKELEFKKSWESITHPEDLDGCKSELKNLLESDDTEYSISKRFLSKLGASVYCHVVVSKVTDKDGKYVHLIKQVQPIRLPDSNVQVTTDKAGDPILQPIVPVAQFVARNWKPILAVVGPPVVGILTWIGTTISGYYELKSKSEYQENQMKSLKSKVDQLPIQGHK